MRELVAGYGACCRGRIARKYLLVDEVAQLLRKPQEVQAWIDAVCGKADGECDFSGESGVATSHAGGGYLDTAGVNEEKRAFFEGFTRLDKGGDVFERTISGRCRKR